MRLLPFTNRFLQEERLQVPHGSIVASIPQTQQAYVAMDTSSFRDATAVLRNSPFRSLAPHPHAASSSAMNDENRSGNTTNVVDRQNGEDPAVTGCDDHIVDCHHGSSNLALAHSQSPQQSHAFLKARSIGHAATSSDKSLFDMDSANMHLDSDHLDLKRTKSESHPFGKSNAEFSGHLASTSHKQEIQLVKVSPLRCRRGIPPAGHRPVPTHVEFATNSDPFKESPKALSLFPSHQKCTSPMNSDSIGGHALIMVGQKMKLSHAELMKRGEIAESSKRSKCPAVGALSSTGRNKLGRRGSKPPNEQVIESQNHQLEWASYQNSKLLNMNSTLQKILLVKDKTIEEMGKQLNEKNTLLAVKDNEKENVPRDHKIALLEKTVEVLQARMVQLELSVDGNRNGQTDTPTKATQRQHQTPKPDHCLNKRVTRSASKKK